MVMIKDMVKQIEAAQSEGYDVRFSRFTTRWSNFNYNVRFYVDGACVGYWYPHSAKVWGKNWKPIDQPAETIWDAIKLIDVKLYKPEHRRCEPQS